MPETPVTGSRPRPDGAPPEHELSEHEPPAADQPAADQSAANPPVADQSAANPPVAGQSAANPPVPEADWPEPAVRLTDARSLRAFAHPLRVRLMSALRSYGALTATQAAEYLGDTPSNCSFHLRTLGSFGVIEQVPGSDNRSRPWQAVRGSVSFDPDDSAESRAAWEAASDVLHSSAMDELATWIRLQPDQREPWHEGWFDSNVTAPMTADELRRLGRQISALLQPFADRKTARLDAGEPLLQDGELPVRVLTIGFPNAVPRPVDTGSEPP